MFDVDEFFKGIEEDKKDFFRTEMTHNQFAALANVLEKDIIMQEILSLDYYQNKLKPALNLNIETVEKYLKNAWSTEYILSQNKLIIEKTGQAFAIQWAFPQAYYSVFTSTLSCFKSLGYTEESHASVLKKFSGLLTENKYPLSLSFSCKGTKKKPEFLNITCPNKSESSVEYNENNPDSVNKHICQFLKSTREHQLEEKSEKLKFKNKQGVVLKRLTESKWIEVSNTLHNITILDLLYRKRIKANYQDIDTFTSEKLKGKEILNNLIHIVECINMTNEVLIAKAIGVSEFERIKNNHLKVVENDILKKRFEFIIDRIKL
jgi:hypothetical protein